MLKNNQAPVQDEVQQVAIREMCKRGELKWNAATGEYELTRKGRKAAAARKRAKV